MEIIGEGKSRLMGMLEKAVDEVRRRQEKVLEVERRVVEGDSRGKIKLEDG